MALSPVYAAILQDLNRAVAHGQPEDVLQFCANWFNAKLEEQRIAGRLSIAQAEGAAAMAGSSGRSKSLAPLPSASTFPPQMHHAQQAAQAQAQQSQYGAAASNHPALRKKGSLPSLAGQGYTFGSGAAAAVNGSSGKPAYYDSAHPSPFSEAPPPSNVRGGGQAHHAHPHHSSRNGPPPPPSGAVPSGSPSTGGIMWNRPFPAMHGGAGGSRGGDAGPTDIDMQHEDDEDAAARISEGRDRLGAISPGNTARNGGGLHPSSSSSSLSAAADNGIPQGYNLGRRTSVSAESIDPNSLSNSAHSIPKVVIPKTPSQRARIESSTEKNLLFRNLDEEQHNDVVNAMKEVQVTQGTEVIVQGAVGDFFYVVESGDFQIWVKPQQSSGMVMSPTMPSNANNGARGRSVSVEPEGSMKEDLQATTTLEDGTQVRADGSKLVATITSGGSFGELALMYNAPRAATVVCSSENATLWALDRVTFRTILMEHTSKKRRMYEKFLSEVPILVSLEGYERSKIADALEERIYEEGEDVVREGELGKNFYIIESGKAEVLKRKEGGVQERVGTLTKGDYFGELALLNSAPRAATVRATSGRLRVATLGEKAFTRLLGPVVEILTRSAVTKYGAQSVASGESSRGGGVNNNNNNSKESQHAASRHERERERSGTSTPTTAAAAGREREKDN